MVVGGGCGTPGVPGQLDEPPTPKIRLLFDVVVLLLLLPLMRGIAWSPSCFEGVLVSERRPLLVLLLCLLVVLFVDASLAMDGSTLEVVFAEGLKSWAVF